MDRCPATILGESVVAEGTFAGCSSEQIPRDTPWVLRTGTLSPPAKLKEYFGLEFVAKSRLSSQNKYVVVGSGDSGGGLLAKFGNSWVVAGVASSVMLCTDESGSGVLRQFFAPLSDNENKAFIEKILSTEYDQL